MPARGVRDAQRENGGLWRISACRAGGEQRGSHGRRAERQPDHDRGDHPGVPERDLLPALGGPVIGPAGLEHLYLKSALGVYDVALRAFELRRGRVILSGVHDGPEAVSPTGPAAILLSLPLLSPSRAQNLTSATCLRRKTPALPGLLQNGIKINTFLPHRLKNVPSAATTTGVPGSARCFTIRRATARPRSSTSHAAPEKNQQARRHCPAIWPAAAIATTVP